MADVKTLQTRIALKYDTYVNWTNEDVEGKGANLVLLKGEIGICEIPSGNANATTAPTVLFKVGDGVSTFKSLKWASALAADVHDWAKAETVVLDGTSIKFKTGDVEKHTIDLSDFATDAEVKAITDPLAARIEAVENKFNGDDSIQGQIDALDGRLDVIEGEGEGSVKKALADAKAYTDAREEAITSAYETYADQAEADAKSYADTELAKDRSRITAVESDITTIKGTGEGSIAKAVADAVTEVKAYADTAESDAVTTANAYTDTRETAIKTAYEAYADQAEADAKSYVDGKVTTINAKDADQDTEIAKKLDAATFNTYIAGKEMSDADLKKYAEDEADAAQSAAIAAAKTETESQISTLVTSGQVKTNTDAIAQNKADIAAMDTAYKKAVYDEAKAREDADKALDERLVEVEAFFKTTDGETLDTALDTLKEIQDYLNGEGSATDGIIGRVAQAEADIDDLEAEFAAEGRVTVAEGKISALEARATEIEKDVDTKLATETFNTWKTAHEDDHAGTATEITAEIAAAVSGEETARKAADKAITDAIGTSADGKDVATVYGAIADAKAAGTGADAKATANAARLDVVEPKVTTLQDLVEGYSDKGSIKAAVDAAQKAADDAQDAADKAQEEIDALELVVGDANTGLAKTKEIADKAASDVAALTTRVTDAEGDIDDLEAIVNDASQGNAKLRSDVNALQTLTGDASKGNEALRSELTTLQGVVNNETTGLAATKAIADKNKTDIGLLDGRVTAIENDYLKAADVYVFNCGSSSAVVHEQPKQA